MSIIIQPPKSGGNLLLPGCPHPESPNKLHLWTLIKSTMSESAYKCKLCGEERRAKCT